MCCCCHWWTQGNAVRLKNIIRYYPVRPQGEGRAQSIRVSARQGRPQDLGGGGGQEIFFSDLGICMSQSDILRMAKPCALLGGFGGMLPRENFLKRCNLVRFRVYFDQILSLFFSKKCHFLYKK